MITPLHQIPYETTGDISRVHETAMQLGRLVGLLPLAQIEFAAATAALVAGAKTTGGAVHFNLKQQESGEFWLEANMESSIGAVSRQVPGLFSIPVLPDKSAAFWKSRQQIEDFSQDMEQFTFAISHDLKNSLTKLKLALSLVEEEELPSLVHHYIQIIHRSAWRLERTMLGLNQIIELGYASYANIKKICPQELFGDVYDEFAESLARVNAIVKSDFSGVNELYYLEIYLKSIFTNMVSNAIKYRVPERPLEINISFHRAEDACILVFKDNGQGIDLEKHGPKLFLPFTRFSGNTEGSGIGLYLIKNMVERNGGRIEVDSHPGQGTTFRFTLKEYLQTSKN